MLVYTPDVMAGPTGSSAAAAWIAGRVQTAILRLVSEALEDYRHMSEAASSCFSRPFISQYFFNVHDRMRARLFELRSAFAWTLEAARHSPLALVTALRPWLMHHLDQFLDDAELPVFTGFPVSLLGGSPIRLHDAAVLSVEDSLEVAKSFVFRVHAEIEDFRFHSSEEIRLWQPAIDCAQADLLQLEVSAVRQVLSILHACAPLDQAFAALLTRHVERFKPAAAAHRFRVASAFVTEL